MPRRPKKKRRKDKDELVKPKYGKASRVGYKVRCSKCKQVGHRKNKCLQNDNVDNTGQFASNVQNSQFASNVQNSQSATNVQSSTTVDVGSTCERKRQFGVGLYTNLKTGEQTYNRGHVSLRGHVAEIDFFLTCASQSRVHSEMATGTAPPRGSAAAAANMRRRRTTSGAGSSGGAAGTMLQFYTDDAPGLKISPNAVLVMSIGFIAFVAVLHVMGKLYFVRKE
ncbi:hypothetical protein V6N13_140136 [Hibiscus sabdariffa]